MSTPMPDPCPICHMHGPHKMDCPNRGARHGDYTRVAPELACGDCEHLRIRQGGAPRCMRHGRRLEMWQGEIQRCKECE